MILNVDENDQDSVESNFQILLKLRKKFRKADPRKIEKQYLANMAKFEKEYASIMKIFETDINSLYNTDKIDKNDSSYYVYCHCNPLKQLNIKKMSKHAFCAMNLGLNFEAFTWEKVKTIDALI